MKDFSTGMKAKLKVITAISHRAKLLLLDEPTSGLDVVARDELLDLLAGKISLSLGPEGLVVTRVGE